MPIVPTNETDLVDALGTVHEVASATARIVSLVPSITELLFDLGLATNVVGRTGFCIHPAELVKRVPKVGGTKSIDIGRLKRLAPTHIIVNIDENPRARWRSLRASSRMSSSRIRWRRGTIPGFTGCSAGSSRARKRHMP